MASAPHRGLPVGHSFWRNLSSLAMHHTLPRMISDDGVDDPAEWNDHPHLAVPGESTLAPWISFSRMCRLYGDMLGTINGEKSNLRMLEWLTCEWKRWRRKWLSVDHSFLPLQLASLRLCEAFLRFHIAEYRLLYVYKYKTQSLVLSEPSETTYAFHETVEAAFAVAKVFEDFDGFLAFSFNLLWVALAVTLVWLVKVGRT